MFVWIFFLIIILSEKSKLSIIYSIIKKQPNEISDIMRKVKLDFFIWSYADAVALKERYVDFFHKATSVQFFLFSGTIRKILERAIRDWDNKKVCPADLYFHSMKRLHAYVRRLGNVAAGDGGDDNTN